MSGWTGRRFDFLVLALLRELLRSVARATALQHSSHLHLYL